MDDGSGGGPQTAAPIGGMTPEQPQAGDPAGWPFAAGWVRASAFMTRFMVQLPLMAV